MTVTAVLKKGLIEMLSGSGSFAREPRTPMGEGGGVYVPYIMLCRLPVVFTQEANEYKVGIKATKVRFSNSLMQNGTFSVFMKPFLK